MKQRETIFCEEYIDKINPPKHITRRPASNIAQFYKMDLKKGYEMPPPKPNPQTVVVRNLETSKEEAPLSPSKKAKGGCYRDINKQSTEENTLGIQFHKKIMPKEDNIKNHKVVAVELDQLKYKNPNRTELINKYMNSSGVKDVFQMDSNIYYKGLLEKNKI